MNFQWAGGFHPPKTVNPDDPSSVMVIDPDEAGKVIGKMKDPTPPKLLEASKRPTHLFHHELWSEGDDVWAERGRLDRCRKILSSLKTVVSVGGKSIEVRAVEFVRTDSSQRWYHTRDIVKDDELRDAYIAEIVRLQEQATAKMVNFQEFMKGQK